MAVIDFLIYFLTYWFDENRQLLTWSTPLKRASYAIGLATMCFFYSIGELVEFTVYKTTDFQFSKIFFVLLGIGSMQLYEYIYITRNRYEKIISSNKFSKISKKKGVGISMAILFTCVMMTFFMFMIFVPFGSDKLK